MSGERYIYIGDEVLDGFRNQWGTVERIEEQGIFVRFADGDVLRVDRREIMKVRSR